MDALKAYNQWLIKYKSNLDIIRGDLNLIINKKINIFFAVDFHDIYDYCFPFLSYYKSLDNNKLKEYFNLQISRSILFFMLDNIYAKPILLLPPYLRETNDFLQSLQSQAKKFTDYEFKKTLLNKPEISYAINCLNKSQTVNFEELLDLLDSKAIDMAGFFVMFLSSGLDMYFNLMKGYITPSPDFLDKLVHKNSNIDNDYYFSIYKSILTDGNRDLGKIVSNVREDKPYQNERDAEALRYIIELNNILSKSNAVIFLISSAPHMMRLQNSPLIHKNICGNHLTLLRDPSFLITMVQEIANLFRYHKEKLSLENINLNDLMSVIDLDLIKLDSFLLYSTDFSAQGGNFIESVKMDSLNQIIDLSERLDNMDLALLIDQFLPNIDNSFVLKPNNIESDIIESLTELSKLLEQKDFTEKIFKKITELERARLESFWDMMKERNIIDLMFPFKVFINNKKYKKSIDDIINLIVKGQFSLKEQHRISKELLDRLHLKLRMLSSNELYLEQHNEKYLIWIIIFLIFDRTDLIEMCYKQFIDKISELDIKRELTYIYLKSLIDSLIKRKGFNMDIIEFIDLCYTYGEIHYHPQYDIIDSQFDKMTQKSIKEILKNLNKELIDGVDAIRLSEFAWAIKVEAPYYIICYNKNNKIQIISVDIRFIHLILIAINEYQKNYFTKGETINEIVNKLDDIYLPLVQNLEFEYRVPLFSNYAYLLAQLSKRDQSSHYLFRALELIKEIENNLDALYLNYYDYYMASFIYCELACNSTGNIKKRYRSKALYLLDRVIETLPNGAKKFKDDIKRLKLICNSI